MIDSITQNIINKVIKRPAKQLSANGKEVDKLSEALIKLFELTPHKIGTQKH